MANMESIRKVKAKNGNRAYSLPEGTIKDTKIKHAMERAWPGGASDTVSEKRESERTI